MPAPRKPNIVLVFSDQHRGQDLGVAGNAQVQTPNLDRLAAEGLYLPNTFSNCPVCCPARAVLLTGKYPHRAGLRINDQRIPIEQASLATELNALGYVTGFVGKWHLDGAIREPGFVPKERRLGFQWWAANECRHAYFDTWYFRDDPEPIPMGQYETLEWTDAALEFIRGHKVSPFCLLVGYGPPHDPYVAPPEYMERYPSEEVKLRPNFVHGTQMGPGGREVTAANISGYYAAITCIDDQVGRIMRALDEEGIADDTLFIFTSDHGDMLGSNGYILKRKPHEESIRVPGIFRWPNAIRPGRTKDAIFSWVDLMPTLLSLSGAPVPAGVQGQDLSSVLLDPADDGPESAYLTIYMPYPTKVEGGWRGVRTKRNTYARYEDRPWVLFDNQDDPYQRTNLVEDVAAVNLRDELEALTRDWMEKTGDSWDYNVPKTTTLHLNPAEEHAAMIAAAYRECGRRMP